MADIVSDRKRSQMMSRVKGRDTKPEIAVRSLLHRAGFRFRLRRRDLPGRPDLVLPKYSAVVFVHGCFWHAHDCARYRLPDTRADFWAQKARANRERDARNVRKLLDAGWRVAVIWECALSGKGQLSTNQLAGALESWLREGREELLEIKGTNGGE